VNFEPFVRRSPSVVSRTTAGWTAEAIWIALACVCVAAGTFFD
jgi:hypothetical protein